MSDIYSDMTLDELKKILRNTTAAIEQHRAGEHKTTDRETFFDCVTCGFLEARERHVARLVAGLEKMNAEVLPKGVE